MYQKILVAFDGSPESRLAVDECSHLMQVSGRQIHLVCVLHDPSPYLLAALPICYRRVCRGVLSLNVRRWISQEATQIRSW